MSKGRPFPDGKGRRTSIIIRPDIWARIGNGPNVSELINDVLERELFSNGDPRAHNRLLQLERELTHIQDERAALDAQEAALQAERERLLEDNKQVLATHASDIEKVRRETAEMFLRKYEKKPAVRAEVRGWWSARLDKLKECDFSDPETATDWTMSELTRMADGG